MVPWGSLWDAALARVPGEALTVTRLGGTANATWRVETPQGVFAVRLHEGWTNPVGVDRRREALLHAAAARAGLAPGIIAADPAGRFLITQFIAGPSWTAADMGRAEPLRRVARQLRTLHELPAPGGAAVSASASGEPLVSVSAPESGASSAQGSASGEASWSAGGAPAPASAPPPLAPWNLGDLLLTHAAALTGADPALEAEFAPLLARAHAVLAEVAADGRPLCIVHNDVNHANLVGPQPLLLDFEYAAVADPLSDLACLLAYYPEAGSHALLLLAESGLDAVPVAQLQDLAWVYALVSWLWYRRYELTGGMRGGAREAMEALRRRLG